MRRLHVAVLDEEMPYPPDSGKRLRTYNLLRRLADRHRVTLLCHRNAEAGEADVAARAYRDLGVDVRHTGEPLPPKRGPAFAARLAANLVSPLPYSVASHQRPALARLVDTLAAEGTVDVWHCEWTPYAEYLRRRPALAASRWLVMAHNVESVIWRRTYEAETHPLKRWYIRQQWRKFERFERWAYSSAPLTVAVSGPDAARIRDEYGGRRVEVIDNGVDTDFFRPMDAPRDPRRVLFLGSLDWRPNLDGVRWLLEAVWPRVLADEPSARLSLVGRRPPEWLRRAVAAVPSVELYADVPDVRPHLASAGMLAVSLRVGGGSRLKILEALAAGTPVVSTTVGAEGLELEPGRHYAPADDEATFAAALVAGMRRPADEARRAEAGRARVLSRYDWGGLADRLDGAWRSLAEWPGHTEGGRLTAAPPGVVAG